ncbi:MAG: calcium-binding EGF-like domain-containing protein [Bacteroidia bacterium]|nr:calcium-binding EGF-like domain-containing protein [Bacteroidia bacterium]
MGLLFTITGCDPCANTECLNGGSCVDGTCVCATGYEGSDCSTLSRAKLIGAYNVAETCSGSPFTYACTISGSTSDDLKINFSNFYDLLGFYGISTPVTATMSGEESFVVSTTITSGADTYTVSGNGSVNSDATLSLTYNVDVNGTVDACTATYTLQ